MLKLLKSFIKISFLMRRKFKWIIICFVIAPFIRGDFPFVIEKIFQLSILFQFLYGMLIEEVLQVECTIWILVNTCKINLSIVKKCLLGTKMGAIICN